MAYVWLHVSMCPSVLRPVSTNQRPHEPATLFFFFKQKTAYEIGQCLEFRRVLFRSLGYVEQLYTFGDRGRHTQAGDTDAHVASIGYLALTRAADNTSPAEGATFEPWYRFFPWEDWREARPALIERDILPELTRWAAQSEQPEVARAPPRPDRGRPYFRTQGAHWGEE